MFDVPGIHTLHTICHRVLDKLHNRSKGKQYILIISEPIIFWRLFLGGCHFLSFSSSSSSMFSTMSSMCFYLRPSQNIIIIFRANAPAAASSQLNAIESFIVTCIFSIFSAIIEYAVVLAIITLRFVKYSSPFSNIFITEKNIISQKFLLSSKFLLQCLKCTTFSSPSYMKGIKRIWRMQGKEKKT